MASEAQEEDFTIEDEDTIPEPEPEPVKTIPYNETFMGMFGDYIAKDGHVGLKTVTIKDNIGAVGVDPEHAQCVE